MLCNISQGRATCSVSFPLSWIRLIFYVWETYRRGIGRHLLKASEELIYKMSSSREVYLHCRMIDTTPLNMYTKAGYRIIKTDSILILLLLQRRKHLMCKELSVLSALSKPDLSASAEESKSLMDPRHVS